MAAMRLGVSQAIVGGTIVAGDIAVEDGVIREVGLPPGRRGTALPGLIDLQVNGWAGVDFQAAPDIDGYRFAGRQLASTGVTAFQPTIVTDSPTVLIGALRAAAAVTSITGLQRWRNAAVPVGVHVEGPFISPRHLGAHRRRAVRAPDIALARRLAEAGPVTTMTIAPEESGGSELIRWAAGEGIVAQLGHSDATAAQARAGFAAGARSVTHLFNAMRPLHHRDPGIVGAALTDARISVQIIADGVHLAPEIVDLVVAACGTRTILVTDAICAAPARDGAGFTVGGRSGSTVDGAARLDDGTLAGGTSSLLDQLRRLTDRGWPLPTVADMVTRTPARLLGLSGRGDLRPGDRADVVIVDDGLDLRAVYIAGAAVS